MGIYLLLCLLLVALPTSAQLSVGTNGMTVLPNTTVSVDGLTLTPSLSLSVTNNSLQRTSTPVTGNPSIPCN
ncbi:hypothetical protein [Spirosoma validum]|uniref:Uncharacterized protein n=1 Tax=Spirosoma validum TaxID=2771355 RepID=A0A927GH90_9BACT|nr:hypothetical protein [Spirosoma validum]MBD2757493.1 hypothetical protein [Spirosoma validum]